MIEPKLEKSRVKSKQRSPVVSDSQARKTALIVALVLALIAVWNIYRGRFTVVAVLGGVAVLLTLIGLFVPVAARSFHRFWMGLAGVLGYVNSRILLTILYYGLLTPYGVVSRLVGRDPLDRRGPSRDTYWVKRETTRQTPQQFERLF
ncbi:MAG TPA: SxtJ family membrane protein [Pyrinomonadaceae bacterium]|nr:SxtJ family membrane protein [Pyrinomonadaceae bacterium]